MKILHVTNTFLTSTLGGVERLVDTICTGFAVRGIQSDVCTMDRCRENFKDQINGYIVYSFKTTFSISSANFSLSLLNEFKELISSYDIIHFHFPNPMGDVLNLLHKITKPKIVTYHSDIVDQKFLKIPYFPLQNHFLNSMSLIVCTSENYKNSSSTLKRRHRKIVVIPIGIKDYFNQSLLKNNKHKEFFGGDSYFIFVGASRDYKGIKILGKAVALAKVNLLTIGFEVENLIRSDKKLFIDKKNIINLGKVDEITKFYAIAKCVALILPSTKRSEAFGISLVEGAMMGKPLISTALDTGTSFVNKHNVTGFEVPANNYEAISKSLVKLLRHNEKANKMGEQSRNHYLKNFTKNAMIDKYQISYKKILNNHSL